MLTVRLWDTATGAHRKTLKGHNGPVYAVAFSPDGTTVASASLDATVRLWDAATGAHRKTLEGHSWSVNAVAFSPDGTTVASASHDCTVRLWDTQGFEFFLKRLLRFLFRRFLCAFFYKKRRLKQL